MEVGNTAFTGVLSSQRLQLILLLCLEDTVSFPNQQYFLFEYRIKFFNNVKRKLISGHFNSKSDTCSP